MCGIFCLVSNDCSKSDYIVEFFGQNVIRRGPDYHSFKKCFIGKDLHLHFLSSVLWMQGEKLIPQPIDTPESVFLYNGNLYKGISNEQQKCGDTNVFLKLLENGKGSITELTSLKGPYTFIYFNKNKNKIYFSRDQYGRISLLLGKNNKDILLTSVSKKGQGFNFIEVPSIGTFCLCLESNKISLIPYKQRNKNFIKKVKEVENFLDLNLHIEEDIEHLFVQYHDPSDCDIDFIKEMNNLSNEESFKILLLNYKWNCNLLKLEELLQSAVCKRVDTQPKYCQNCIKYRKVCNHSLVGILFSGGVDCAVLALLVDKVYDKSRTIDLMNVAFNEHNNFDSPDRQTGIQTLNELKKICPNRKWRFLEINVPLKELEEMRKQHISDLIYPLQTVLDDSLGCALWFASRGSTTNYTSPCRVLLAGMGADELFGGYTKHRAAFKNGSWPALHQALDEDWQNLPHRNLARDNRVACDHGREIRTPYLDEEVVEFVRSLPTWEKTCPTEQLRQGFGEKLLLRLLAYRLGLEKASVLKKRALQFGSRIANKNENAHEISQRLL